MSKTSSTFSVCQKLLLFVVGFSALLSGIVLLANYFQHRNVPFPWSLYIGLLNVGFGFLLLLTALFHKHPSTRSEAQIALIQLPAEAMAPFLPAVGPAPMLSPSPSAPYYYAAQEDPVSSV